MAADDPNLYNLTSPKKFDRYLRIFPQFESVAVVYTIVFGEEVIVFTTTSFASFKKQTFYL